jgi:hypothetical protein
VLGVGERAEGDEAVVELDGLDWVKSTGRAVTPGVRHVRHIHATPAHLHHLDPVVLGLVDPVGRFVEERGVGERRKLL